MSPRTDPTPALIPEVMHTGTQSSTADVDVEGRELTEFKDDYDNSINPSDEDDGCPECLCEGRQIRGEFTKDHICTHRLGFTVEYKKKGRKHFVKVRLWKELTYHCPQCHEKFRSESGIEEHIQDIKNTGHASGRNSWPEPTELERARRQQFVPPKASNRRLMLYAVADAAHPRLFSDVTRLEIDALTNTISFTVPSSFGLLSRSPRADHAERGERLRTCGRADAVRAPCGPAVGCGPGCAGFGTGWSRE
ncbi:hypothetical protein B0H11DRAFT_2271087 [Mycena galericulata]|nr:hypothetical protein B0H11DRAFT_2271087 [Mycena galericulata]